MILPRENDRIANWVDEAVEQGAEALCGGAKQSDTCYQPTVLLEPDAQTSVSKNEIFGPVTCIYGYDAME